jgi:hypothetical protein
LLLIDELLGIILRLCFKEKNATKENAQLVASLAKKVQWAAILLNSKSNHSSTGLFFKASLISYMTLCLSNVVLEDFKSLLWLISIGDRFFVSQQTKDLPGMIEIAHEIRTVGSVAIQEDEEDFIDEEAMDIKNAISTSSTMAATALTTTLSILYIALGLEALAFTFREPSGTVSEEDQSICDEVLRLVSNTLKRYMERLHCQWNYEQPLSLGKSIGYDPYVFRRDSKLHYRS